MRRIQLVHWICSAPPATYLHRRWRLGSLERAIAKRADIRCLEARGATELVLLFACSLEEAKAQRIARMQDDDTLDTALDD